MDWLAKRESNSEWGTALQSGQPVGPYIFDVDKDGSEHLKGTVETHMRREIRYVGIQTRGKMPWASWTPRNVLWWAQAAVANIETFERLETMAKPILDKLTNDATSEPGRANAVAEAMLKCDGELKALCADFATGLTRVYANDPPSEKTAKTVKKFYKILSKSPKPGADLAEAKKAIIKSAKFHEKAAYLLYYASLVWDPAVVDQAQKDLEPVLRGYTPVRTGSNIDDVRATLKSKPEDILVATAIVSITQGGLQGWNNWTEDVAMVKDSVIDQLEVLRKVCGTDDMAKTVSSFRADSVRLAHDLIRQELASGETVLQVWPPWFSEDMPTIRQRLLRVLDSKEELATLQGNAKEWLELYYHALMVHMVITKPEYTGFVGSKGTEIDRATTNGEVINIYEAAINEHTVSPGIGIGGFSIGNAKASLLARKMREEEDLLNRWWKSFVEPPFLSRDSEAEEMVQKFYKNYQAISPFPIDPGRSVYPSGTPLTAAILDALVASTMPNKPKIIRYGGRTNRADTNAVVMYLFPAGRIKDVFWTLPKEEQKKAADKNNNVFGFPYVSKQVTKAEVEERHKNKTLHGCLGLLDVLAVGDGFVTLSDEIICARSQASYDPRDERVPGECKWRWDPKVFYAPFTGAVIYDERVPAKSFDHLVANWNAGFKMNQDDEKGAIVTRFEGANTANRLWIDWKIPPKASINGTTGLSSSQPLSFLLAVFSWSRQNDAMDFRSVALRMLGTEALARAFIRRFLAPYVSESAQKSLMDKKNVTKLSETFAKTKAPDLAGVVKARGELETSAGWKDYLPNASNPWLDADSAILAARFREVFAGPYPGLVHAKDEAYVSALCSAYSTFAGATGAVVYKSVEEHSFFRTMRMDFWRQNPDLRNQMNKPPEQPLPDKPLVSALHEANRPYGHYQNVPPEAIALWVGERVDWVGVYADTPVPFAWTEENHGDMRDPRSEVGSLAAEIAQALTGHPPGSEGARILRIALNLLQAGACPVNLIDQSWKDLKALKEVITTCVRTNASMPFPASVKRDALELRL